MIFAYHILKCVQQIFNLEKEQQKPQIVKIHG